MRPERNEIATLDRRRPFLGDGVGIRQTVLGNARRAREQLNELPARSTDA